jgi:hypothetical protein
MIEWPMHECWTTAMGTKMKRTEQEQHVQRALLDLIFPAPRRRLRLRFEYDDTHHAAADQNTPRAVILGRLSLRTLAVRWSDAQSGCYGEQLWRLGRARIHSRCAATGQAICPGDPIFKPAVRVHSIPFNRHWMILAAAAEVGEDDGEEI